MQSDLIRFAGALPGSPAASDGGAAGDSFAGAVLGDLPGSPGEERGDRAEGGAQEDLGLQGRSLAPLLDPGLEDLAPLVASSSGRRAEVSSNAYWAVRPGQAAVPCGPHIHL